MNKLGIKRGIALLLGISLIALTGCKKNESKTLKELGDVGKYITIDYAEGASFDVRREDYGEERMYMPKPYFNEETEVPVVYNTYEGFALFHNQKYLYFYDKEVELPLSLNDMTNSDDVFSCLKKMGIDLDLVLFRFKKVDNLSMSLNEKNIKYCFELKFSYQPRYTRENINTNDLSGFGIITEDENGKNSIFIFGCLENMETEDEIEHIKESFCFNNNKFNVPEKDLQTEHILLYFDYEIDKLEADILSCFCLDTDKRERKLNAFHGENGFYGLKLKIQESSWSGKISEFISDYYSDYTERKEFTDKNGNKWKCVESIKEDKKGNKLVFVYITNINDKIFEITLECPALDVYSCIVDGMDNSISTINIYN